MVSLNTRQRDLLQILLDATEPLGAAELAAAMSLTPRQVNYGLRGLRQWLAERDVALEVTPGVGVRVRLTEERSRQLVAELGSIAGVRLLLTSEQRQQLLALVLLDADEPLILYQMERLADVSRTTILRDLDGIETWLPAPLTLERRPNYGIWIDGDEQDKRQAILMLLWGEGVPGPSLVQCNHTDGLVFTLRDDAALLSLVARVEATLAHWDMKRAFGQVAYAEAQLGGRFTDDAVLYLALSLAIQADRIRRGHLLAVADQHFADLKNLPIWGVSAEIAERLSWRGKSRWPRAEAASIAMHILSAPRNERWPGDTELDSLFIDLVDVMMARIGDAYGLPALSHDTTLRDGLAIQVIPACLRQRYGLWMPSQAPETLSADRFAAEHQLARQLDELIAKHMGEHLHASELSNLALLLRAAYIRAQPGRAHRVLIVCPSGMATAQLLVARLKARFPSLGALIVLSLRELSQHHVEAADLVISTVPLPAGAARGAQVIRVHPLLLPEDVEAITQWLA
jgi:mannitol operon transcriptional antiterminator